MEKINTDYDMDFWKSLRMSVFKGSSLTPKSLKFGKNVAAVWKSFKKLFVII